MKWIFTFVIFICGLTAEAQISASPGFIDFGDVAINQGSRQTSIWVRNSSNRPMNVRVSSSCFGNFQSYNNCYSLPAYGSCSVQITYRPRTLGYDSCQISINGNPGGYSSVSVRGRGVEHHYLEVNPPYAE